MESLTLYFVIFLSLYLAFMFWSVKKSKNEYVKEQSGFSAVIGMTTFVATLFSTFTLMGMPDFFRNHGVGAWLFLGVTDAAMAFVVLWFGLKVRSYARRLKFNSISEVINEAYGGNKGQFIYLLGIFIFLIPYVAIQLHGISIFMSSIWGVPEWILSLLILICIFLIIQYGGFSAIVRSDVIQWGIVFIAVWIIGVYCLSSLGGMHAGLEKINAQNPGWLSTPGPKGLFTWEFLVASFIAIVLMPISQPQLAWRVTKFKNDEDLRFGAIGIGIFAFLVILPTLFIGMYGAVYFPHASSPEFWKAVLVDEQSSIVAAMAMVGLLAASMSTADSQLHSLRREFLGKDEMHQKSALPVLIIFFAASYLLSLISSSELILLARISFAGTALVAPMVLIAFISKGKKCNGYIPIVSGLALVTLLMSTFGLIPSKFLNIRADLVLIVLVFAFSFLLYLFFSRPKREGLYGA